MAKKVHRHNLPDNMRRLRKSKGINQDKLADALLISRYQLGSYEENRAEPSIDVLVAMAKYFNVTLEELVK